MSVYENIICGKLKLKGKAMDVKARGVKKKKPKYQYDQGSNNGEDELPAVGDMIEADNLGEGHPPAHQDLLMPAEKRYIEQIDKINVYRLAKIANKSHHDRIQDFNQYLVNLSEHYSIPKVGLG